jgi:hypothetical protein
LICSDIWRTVQVIKLFVFSGCFSSTLNNLRIILSSSPELKLTMKWSSTFETFHYNYLNSYNNSYIFESLCTTRVPGRTGQGGVGFASISCCLATQRQLQNAFAASGWSKTKAPADVLATPPHFISIYM